MRRDTLAIVLLGAMASTVPACHAQARSEWNFVVRLDGKPIGDHRFVVSANPDGTARVASDAHFEVRWLGWTAYRYAHHARERWSGNCLAALEARTDDDGRVTQVNADAAQLAAGCVMSFAYWNAALRTQARLLDPGTGRLVDVKVTPLPPARVDTDRGPVEAAGWRIAGLPNAIDIRWAGDEWVALDTVVGDRHLSYRLR